MIDMNAGVQIKIVHWKSDIMEFDVTNSVSSPQGGTVSRFVGYPTNVQIEAMGVLWNTRW